MTDTSAEEDGPLVLVTSRSFGSGSADPLGLLRRAGLRVEWGAADHDPEALGPLLAEAAGWIAGAAAVREEHLAAAPRLRILARYGTGVEAVDLDAAEHRNVVVTNTPGANAEAVAEHTVALLLACLRRVTEGDREVRSGRWRPLPGRELAALAIGLVGFGRVGRAVARRVVPLCARVLAHDPSVDPAALTAAGVTPASLAEVQAEADVLSLHRPGGGGPLVDAVFLRRLRPGAILINTARGDLLDEHAVAEALARGTLAGLAVDVLASEPPVASPLLDAPNVVITPHTGAHTIEAIDRMGMEAAEEVVRVLVERRPPHRPVTAPRSTTG